MARAKTEVKGVWQDPAYHASQSLIFLTGDDSQAKSVVEELAKFIPAIIAWVLEKEDYEFLEPYREELGQEALIRLWKSRVNGTYDPTKSGIKTWLYRCGVGAAMTMRFNMIHRLESSGAQPLLGQLLDERAVKDSKRSKEGATTPAHDDLRRVLERYPYDAQLLLLERNKTPPTPFGEIAKILGCRVSEACLRKRYSRYIDELNHDMQDPDRGVRDKGV